MEGLARAWLRKAYNDLDTSHQIGRLQDGHLDVGIYHCQQAVEKALKAFLVRHGKSFEKTHDLSRILDQAISIDASFRQFAEAADALTPYAIAYRYPDEGFDEPTRGEFEEALQHAQTIYEFVARLVR